MPNFGALNLNERTAPVDTGPIAVPEAEKPGWLESFSIQSDLAVDQWTDTQTLRRQEAYSDLADALADMGVDRAAMQRTPGFLELDPQWFGGERSVDSAKVWAQIEAQRARRPGAFADLPKTQEEFDRFVLTRQGQRQRDQQRLATASGFTQVTTGFVAGSAADMADSDLGPLQFMIGGGGKTLAQAFLREAVLATVEEATRVPERIRNRSALGEQTTAADVALDLGSTFIFAGALGAGGKAVGDNWGSIASAPKVVQEKAWAAILDRVPGLRDKVGSTIDWSALDTHLPDIVDGLGIRDSLGPEGDTALATLRRDAVVARASPYVDSAAGRTQHNAAMIDAMQRLMESAPDIPVSPLALPRARPSLDGGTAIATGTVAGDARTVLMRRIAVVESRASNTARNPRSSATGKYQFIGDTWLRLYRARYGQNGLSNAAILAKRGDGKLQDILMHDLVSENERALRAASIPIDAGNLYLAHFAGSGGAVALHRASPTARARAVLGDAVVDANPFLDRMTASEVIDWAARKMNGGGARGSSGAGSASDGASALDTIAADIEALRSQRAELMGNEPEPGVPGRSEAIDAGDDLIPVDDIAADVPELREGFLPEGQMDEAVRDALPALREVVTGSRRSLNTRTDELAAELGLEPNQLRTALETLVDQGLLVRAGKTGHLMRKPPAPLTTANTRRPRSLIDFLAERGGLNDDGGDLRGLGLRTSDRRFGSPVIRRTSAPDATMGGGGPSGEGDFGLDSAFQAARDAGYFPELQGRSEANYAEAIDARALLLDAIDAELAGKPRYSEYDFDRLGQYGLRGSTEGDFGAHDALDRGDSADPFDGQDPEWVMAQDEVSIYLSDLGMKPVDMDPDLFDDFTRFYVLAADDGLTGTEALSYAVNLMAERNQAEAFARNPEPVYEPIDYEDFLSARPFYEGQDRAAAGDIPGYAPDPEAASQRGTGGGFDGSYRGEGPETGPIEPGRFADFDDPQGSGAQGQHDSLRHDARAALDRGAQADPNATARQAQEVQLRAEAPLQGANRTGQEQDGTIGLALFDSADAPGFRFDEEGDAMSLRDVLDDLDADEAELKAIRDCLK